MVPTSDQMGKVQINHGKECIMCTFLPFSYDFLFFIVLSPPLSLASGGSHHVVRAAATEDADGADHLPVQVCLPGPHPVPQELPPYLSQAPPTFDRRPHVGKTTPDNDDGTLMRYCATDTA